MKRHMSRVMGQESVVKGQRSRVTVRCHWSEVKDHWSVVTGQRSGVTGQSQGSVFSDQRSVVKGHWSNHFLSSGLIRIRSSRRFGSNDILKTINFQVRDLDLQAMGGGGDGTETNLRLISIIRPYMFLMINSERNVQVSLIVLVIKDFLDIHVA